MISIALILLSSVFFVGIVNRTKSVSSGRIGPGFTQHLKDISRLLKKGSVTSTSSSFIFQLAPSISFVTVIVACLFLPFGDQPSILSFQYDVVVFAYLLALGRFSMVIMAMDTASPFEGMGANREALYGMLVEPAFFILAGSFAVLTGHTSLNEIFRDMHLGSGVSYLMAAFAVYVFLQIAMVENSRLPVDDPKTHLELTMVHEVIILDNSGFDLGMILATISLRFAMFGVLIANFALPPMVPLWGKILIAIDVMALFAVVVGLLESFRARNRMKRNPQFIFTLTSIAILVFFTVLILTNKLVL